MLTELCAELRNYFELPNGKHFGKFQISQGNLSNIEFLREGQYFRIIGSLFNDGVYQFPALGLRDEEFNGSVWEMALPPALISLSEEIEEYQKSDAAKLTGYASESFGGYSYQKFTDGHGGDGSRWQNVFKDRLRKWRKL